MIMLHTNVLPVNETKVIDKVIDIYLYMCDDLNTAEVIRLGERLIDLANRRATDVELYYQQNRECLDMIPTTHPDDLPL